MAAILYSRSLRKNSDGFTVLELLVAMAVLSLLVVMLMNMVDGASRLWRENENRVDSYREARSAMSVIARDIRQMLSNTNLDYVLINSAAFAKLAESDVQKNTNSAGAIFFLTTVPVRAQDPLANKSDICEVGYFLAYGNTSVAPTSGASKTMNIYRYFRSSDGTFSNLVSGPSSLFNNVTITGAESDLLARNIKSLQIRPFHVDTNGNCVVYNAPLYGALPDFVEISMTALNKDAASKMNNLADWTNSGGTLSNVINQAEQTFTTRVKVMSDQ